MLLACSEDAGRYMFGNSSFEVVHNPIDVREFAYDMAARQKLRSELNLGNSLVIGHIVRFAPKKNHRFVVDVFKEIIRLRQDAFLLLVGDGELRTEIENYCNQIGINDKVQMLGLRNDVSRIYQAMDVFLFPSVYEGLGIVAVEAQELAYQQYVLTEYRNLREQRICSVNFY